MIRGLYGARGMRKLFYGRAIYVDVREIMFPQSEIYGICASGRVKALQIRSVNGGQLI